jgi:hypothetical protein
MGWVGLGWIGLGWVKFLTEFRGLGWVETKRAKKIV